MWTQGLESCGYDDGKDEYTLHMPANEVRFMTTGQILTKMKYGPKYGPILQFGPIFR